MKTKKLIRTLESLSAYALRTLERVCDDLHDREDGERAQRRLGRAPERLNETLDPIATSRALQHARGGAVPGVGGRKLRMSRGRRYALKLEVVCARALGAFSMLEDALEEGPPEKVLYRAQRARDRVHVGLEAARKLRPPREDAVTSPAPVRPPAEPVQAPPLAAEGEVA